MVIQSQVVSPKYVHIKVRLKGLMVLYLFIYVYMYIVIMIKEKERIMDLRGGWEHIGRLEGGKWGH